MPFRQTLKTRISTEFLLGTVATVFGSLVAIYIYQLGLTRGLTDAQAHLNFAKMLFESMTPGVSQIGFWPPLLHVLMAPLVQIPFLYQSGLAGVIVVLPFYVLGTVFSYKLGNLMTGRKWLGLLAALLFMVNPYILYYASAPMMEVMFIGNLIAVAYFVAAWLRFNKLSSLVWAAIFVTLATLSRFEGMLLIPLVAAILIVHLLRRRSRFSEIQAVMILFLLVAVVGAVVIVSYSWFFGGSPMAFTGGSWVRSADPNGGFNTKGNILSSLEYILHASYYMLGQNLVLFAFLCLPFLVMLSRRKMETFGVLAVLASPVVFIALALYSGSYNIALPELPPGKIILNERYGLTWIGFLIMVPVLLIGAVLQMSRLKAKLKYAGISAAVLGALALVYSSGDFFLTVTKTQQYFVIRDNINAPSLYHSQLADYLAKNYDYGKILITRADNDPVLATAGLALDDYIYEANYLYFDQSLNEPWVFARWVVMYNPANEKDKWAQANERVYQKWAGNEQFKYFYELAYENRNRLVYKIRDDRLAEHAQINHLDLAKLPAYNRNISNWDPANFYNSIKLTADVKKN